MTLKSTIPPENRQAAEPLSVIHLIRSDGVTTSPEIDVLQLAESSQWNAHGAKCRIKTIL
jgi:hypothetical protein